MKLRRSVYVHRESRERTGYAGGVVFIAVDEECCTEKLMELYGKYRDKRRRKGKKVKYEMRKITFFVKHCCVCLEKSVFFF